MAQKKTILGEGILSALKEKSQLTSAEIHLSLRQAASYATVKRSLQTLLAENLIATTGKGRGTRYSISPCYEMLMPVDPTTYFQKEIDERTIKANFNIGLLRTQMKTCPLFTETEMGKLQSFQLQFENNIAGLSKAAFLKEFERLAIDLSWKSSQIEGNTYTLLETERLLKEKETAAGRSKDEAIMLLNHKNALDFLLEHTDYAWPLTVAAIEDIHAILIKELDIERNIRQRRVGISGTNYKPLDNMHQIKEALENMCVLVNERTNVFEKALLVLLLLSYIQPFNDGNKRTARIISNAVLLAHRHCPLSFRTTDAMDYKKSMLIFYEQNNISAFKKIFMEQYEFAVNTYF